MSNGVQRSVRLQLRAALHTYMYICNVECIGRDFFVFFQCLHNFNHDDVRRVTEHYLSTEFFMFVSAAVREIHDLNQNKSKEEF